jgi:voltage-gated potassium channel
MNDLGATESTQIATRVRGAQARMYSTLYGSRSSGLSGVQRLMAALIIASVAVTVLGTESAMVKRWPTLFGRAEIFFAVVFVLEYFVRLWAVGADRRFAGVAGRVRYVFTPLALVDMIAILPFVLGWFGAESLVLWVVRLVRLIVLAKLARFSRAIHLLAGVICERRFELGFTALVGMSVVLVASSILYVVEGDIQPEAFGSIPRAMWWAVVTLTTVGYGDVYPQTGLGPLFWCSDGVRRHRPDRDAYGNPCGCFVRCTCES